MRALAYALFALPSFCVVAAMVKISGWRMAMTVVAIALALVSPLVLGAYLLEHAHG